MITSLCIESGGCDPRLRLLCYNAFLGLRIDSGLFHIANLQFFLHFCISISNFYHLRVI